MIDYVSGKLATLTPTMAVIDNQGIGYAVEISLQTYDVLRGKDSATVYIQRQVNPRDGSEVDYGFATQDERELFRLLISVSGIGVASARMMLSALTSEEIRQAILAENVARLKSVKGIGLKSAQRLVLELKDKIVKGEGADSALFEKPDQSALADEATTALTMLGFSKANIAKVMPSILKENPDAKVEDIIKVALKRL